VRIRSLIEKSEQSTDRPLRNSGAGEGNRTPMTSLEGWGSAIELHPRGSRTTPLYEPWRHP
jgi:hypothetical protein